MHDTVNIDCLFLLLRNLPVKSISSSRRNCCPLHCFLVSFVAGLVSPSRCLFPPHTISESFVKHYLENISSFVKTQIAALREVAELFDSMRRRDKELVNMVGMCVCVCVYVVCGVCVFVCVCVCVCVVCVCGVCVCVCACGVCVCACVCVCMYVSSISLFHSDFCVHTVQ